MILIYFLYGTIFGSFLNMLLWRIPRNLSIGGRSQCIHCHHKLSAKDLVPIVSYLSLKGKCRYCHKKIPIRYLINEVICGSVLALIPVTSQPPSILIIISVLIFLTLMLFDFYYYLLPDVVTIPAITGFSVYNILTGEYLSILSGLLYALFFAIIYLISNGKWLGFGDVKLALLIGLVFSYPAGFFVLILGIWLGGIIATFLLITKKATLGRTLPLGSFLSISAIFITLFKDEIKYFERFFY